MRQVAAPAKEFGDFVGRRGYALSGGFAATSPMGRGKGPRGGAEHSGGGISGFHLLCSFNALKRLKNQGFTEKTVDKIGDLFYNVSTACSECGISPAEVTSLFFYLFRQIF